MAAPQPGLAALVEVVPVAAGLLGMTGLESLGLWARVMMAGTVTICEPGTPAAGVVEPPLPEETQVAHPFLGMAGMVRSTQSQE